MSRVITFSRVFPSYHPKAGQPTNFVEKVWKSLGGPTQEHATAFEERKGDYTSSIAWGYRMIDGEKHHTIREGHRWKAGDWFSPAVWGNDINPKSGRSGPYHSKQIKFAPDIQIKKVWDFMVDVEGCFFINQKLYAYPNSEHTLQPLAKNDGLEWMDLLNWFQEPMIGQIICWNENIEY